MPGAFAAMPSCSNSDLARPLDGAFGHVFCLISPRSVPAGEPAGGTSR